jgi:hypothetical protein
LSEPAQAWIGRSPAISIFFKTRDRAIVDHFTVFVAPGRVDNLPDRNLAHVARDDAIDQARRVFTPNPVLKQGRDVDQRCRITNRAVLVLMMRLIRTDGVVTGPLAIIQTLAQLKCSFVERGSDRHVLPQKAVCQGERL